MDIIAREYQSQRFKQTFSLLVYTKYLCGATTEFSLENRWLHEVKTFYLHQSFSETKEGDGDCILSSGLLNLDKQVAIVTCLHPFSTRKNYTSNTLLLPSIKRVRYLPKEV